MLKFNKLKQKLLQNETVIGTFVKSTDPAALEVICMSGLDFVILDNEHTAMNKETFVNLIRVTEIYDVPVIVRVRDNDTSQILQALDAGAYGVQVPNLRTAQDAQKAINSIYYAPKGSRGFANTHRTAAYGLMDVKEYIQLAADNLLFIGYCETLEAYENLDEILSLSGLDIIFIGPSDLSQAFGVLGQVTHPTVLNAVDIIIDKAIAAGKVVGTVASDGISAKKLADRGVRFIVMSSDLGMMASSAKRMLGEFRG